jgi:hypothetical protein
MLEIAVQQGADIDKLEKLMQLQERWEASNAKKSYVAAMSRFRSECPTIAKTRTGHNTKYAGLSESIDQIKGLLAQCGLSHSWSTTQSEALVTVTCTVTHIDGHSESTQLSGGADTSGSKNSIQAIGSTVSYLQRYTLFSILGLASQDMDTDGQAGVPQEAVDAITSAPNIKELQAAFKAAWTKYPNARTTLEPIYTARKKEFTA